MQMYFIFLLVFIFNSSTKEMPGGEWTLWHCCISRKFSGYMYAR